MNFDFVNTGTGSTGEIQEWIVPSTGPYRITAIGAKGGGTYGGRGAKMSGVFALQEGEKLKILVGQAGAKPLVSVFKYYNASGGGGTFIVKEDNTPLIIAGGGGGSGGGTSYQYPDASIEESGRAGRGIGYSSYSGNAPGGTEGNCGERVINWGGAGAGFYTDAETIRGGLSFFSGGVGGTGNLGSNGGFGGGGGATYLLNGSVRYSGGGGGGGYSGGGSALSGQVSATWSNRHCGGGGGSYNVGDEQENLEGIGESHGLVTIEFLQAVSPPKIEEVIVISHSVEIASTSSLGVSNTSYAVSNVYPIESEVEPASLAAAKYLETRAGPMDTTVEVSYKHTSIVTSTVTSLTTKAQRNINYDKYVSTDVSKVTTVNAVNVNVSYTSTTCISEIGNESYAYMVNARGHKISNLPLGAIIRDPETRYNGKPIEWMVVSHNHPGAPAGATMLLAKNALSVKPFSGAADGNKDTGVAFDRYGREDWVNSHLRTWLNQKAALNGGVTAAAVHYNAYDKEPGFINGFSTRFSGSLLQTTIRTGNIGAGATGTYETTDKVFLLSQTEVGLSSYVQEGTPLPAEVHGLIRYAFPTQEAINNDNSGATYSTFDYTGWYLRTPSADYDRRIRFYATSPDTKGNWHGQVFANFGSVAVRPALNMDGNIYVGEESDENGVYTLIYEPEVPVIKQEVVEVHSEVERISSEALRPRQKEFLSTITHAGVVNTSTEAYRASNKVSKTSIEPLYQSISKQIATSIATEVLDVSSEVASEVKVEHITASYTATVECEASSEDTGVKLKVDSFMSPIASYVVVEGKKKGENTVASVINPILSSNSKSIGVTKHESSHLKSIQSTSETSVVAAKTLTVSVTTHVTSCTTNSARIVERVVSLSAYQKLLGSGSSSKRERRASVDSYTAGSNTYAVSTDNNGNTTRYVKSLIEKIHSDAVMTYRGALPIVMVSEVDTDIRMTVEESTVALSEAEFIVALRQIRR